MELLTLLQNVHIKRLTLWNQIINVSEIVEEVSAHRDVMSENYFYPLVPNIQFDQK